MEKEMRSIMAGAGLKEKGEGGGNESQISMPLQYTIHIYLVKHFFKWVQK